MPAFFCVLVLTGEEVPDLFQKLAGEHPDTDPFIRDVNRYHRAEEARHLAFASDQGAGVSLDGTAIPARPAGAGRYVLELASALAARDDVDLTVVARRCKDAGVHSPRR